MSCHGPNAWGAAYGRRALCEHSLPGGWVPYAAAMGANQAHQSWRQTFPWGLVSVILAALALLAVADLAALLDKLRSASMRGRRGGLAVVREMAGKDGA